MSLYRSSVKRLLDVLVSGVVLVLAGPVIGISALAVKLTSRGPAFFTQERAGRDGRAFRIYKLRTMTVDPQRVITQTVGSDPEVLPVGRMLRRLKLDELPQVAHVLRGEMSLVGPRPCLPQTRDETPPWAWPRFEVRPGLTGLAQVNGNASLTWEERWRHDVDYVSRLSMRLDLQILLKTVLIVLFGEERFRSPV